MTMAPERPAILEQEVSAAPSFEFIFGEQNIRPLPLDSLIMLAQIRPTVNGRISELEASIDSDDLDNFPNVARLDESEFARYLDFTNQAWRRTASVVDYLHLQQPDGRFNVVAAGHSRTHSMQNIAQRRAEEAGRPLSIGVNCKIERDNTVRGLVRKQYVENIHAAVPPERAATAIVEMFEFGLGTDWQNAEDFYQQNRDKLSRPVLDKALTYGQLPPQVRELVMTSYLAYDVSLELGKAAKVIRMHQAAELGLPLDTLLGPDSEKAVEYRLLGDAVRIYKEKLKGGAAKRYVASYVQRLQNEISALTGEDKNAIFDETFELPEFKMVSSYEQARAARRKEERRLARLLHEAGLSPHQSTTELMLIVTQDDQGVFEDVLEDAVQANAELTGRLARRRAQDSGQVALAMFEDEQQASLIA